MNKPNGSVEDIFFPNGQLRLDHFEPPAVLALQESLHLARQTRWDNLRTPHLFMGLLAIPDDGVLGWAQRIGADLPDLLQQFQELFQQETGCETSLALHREFLSDNVLHLLRESYARALENGRDQVSSMDLLISLLTTPKSIIAECFEHIGVTAARLTELAVIAEHRDC